MGAERSGLPATPPHPSAAPAHCRCALTRLPETQGKTRLRRELHRLKHTLPEAEQYLSIQTKTLQWLPTNPYQLDVAEFEASLKAAALDQAKLPPNCIGLDCGKTNLTVPPLRSRE
ncbi:hypothetical protein [Phormidium tenue]|uniref:hypothetical protein n=1 Tax=Phormidium tenue TaxID=126344 RepID=UPI001115445D|nr:hypothetical protein [Phormidium tenue]MBD2232424.1 hypothetical protein [Phormidium tenue FACHB-1052]